MPWGCEGCGAKLDYASIFKMIQVAYTILQKKCALFEVPSILLPTNLGQPMYNPSALTENPSPNLAPFVLLELDPVFPS